MVRSIAFGVAVALLLAAAIPARADDRADCPPTTDWVKLFELPQPARVAAACRRLAEQGYAYAQTNLGNLYEYGLGVQQDYAEAMSWFRKAADQGYAGAQEAIGESYDTGAGVRQDFAEAFRWYRKAAGQGDVFAQGVLGYRYEEGQGVPPNYAEAVRWYRKAADQGDATSQFNLGNLYREGLGVHRDYAEAVRWYRRAADQGDAAAQANLGHMYADGLGVPKNYVEAMGWYRKAADHGDAVAKSNIGFLYYEGNGVPRDYVYAYMWSDLGAAGGVKQAAQLRDAVTKLMTPDQIAEAQKLAREWQPVGAQVAATSPPTTSSTEVFGTGFFVARDGQVLTNAHVVEGCVHPHVRLGGDVAVAQVVASDVQNDLALIKTEMRPGDVARLRLSVHQGEEVTVYGFPLAGLLSSGGNVTAGNVAALSGIGDDSRFLQISSPVQPGNSGGPLFDQSGNVIGIVVAKLDALKVASATSDIPQNVNFAIKSSVGANFLDSNNIAYATGETGDHLSAADIAERARAFTVQIECQR